MASFDFVVNGPDLDMRGVISLHRLMRMFEHSRWEAGLLRASAPNRRFVVRSQWSDLPHLFCFHSRFRVVVRLFSVGKTSMKLSHEVFLLEDDNDTPSLDNEPIGFGLTTIVCLDVSTGRPAPLGNSDTGSGMAPPPPTPQFAKWTPCFSNNARAADFKPADGSLPVFCATFPVLQSDCDLNQHANHASYIRWCEDTRAMANHRGALDGSPSERVGYLHLRGVIVDYEAEALPWQEVSVRMWTMQLGRFFFEIWGPNADRSSSSSSSLSFSSSSSPVQGRGGGEGLRLLCLVYGECMDSEKEQEDNAKAIVALDRRAWALKSNL